MRRRFKSSFLSVSCCFLFYFSYTQSISTSEIANAEKMYDLQFTKEKRDSMVSQLNTNLGYYKYLHSYQLPNSFPMPMWFDPVLPLMHYNQTQEKVEWKIPDHVSMPKVEADLAFFSLSELAYLLRNKQITSVKLTQFFISRLKKYGDTLHCVISLTEQIAMQEAKAADENFAKGIHKSPLQGIPYGLKDLFSVKGTKTTWGSPPYKNQDLEENAFVYQQLHKAGAVLIAKLSLGELAMDDVWFGGQTKNPWNLNQGSNGSSAGSASATVAGLVPFAIGTETYGSIVAPSAVCGATGLRPTFGTVARTGAMTLAWTSDRIGPICRSAEDAALVFNYIHGRDDYDRASKNMPFNYNAAIDLKKLKIAYASNYIDSLADSSPEKNVLKVLKASGFSVSPINFPSDLHANDLLTMIWAAESAAAFDPLTRTNKDEEMVQQGRDRYPNVFRSARFMPAVEYINVTRIRYMIMKQVFPLLSQYDIIIVPSMADEPMALTCLTGNPCITLPAGFMENHSPSSITFIGGKLYSEATITAFAKKFQQITGYHLQHPQMFR